MREISLGNRKIGRGFPCLIVAEVSINHNGSLALALESIEAAVRCGVDAVKFQNFRTEDFIRSRSLTYTFETEHGKVTESQYAMFKRCELSAGDLPALKKRCDEQRVLFFSTPTSAKGVEELDRLGVPLLKNGSDYLTHLPLIEVMARTGIPTILSTGMATLGEIEDAVRAFRMAGGNAMMLAHCTSVYPTPAREVNLRRIAVLEEAFGCPVGFSDHTRGIVAAIGAVSVGACLIEKHFTLSKDLPGPDHWFSADPKEMKELVEGVRSVEENLGTDRIEPTPSEEKGRLQYRLSCVASRDLPTGHVLQEQDVSFCRPGTGLAPKALASLLGLRLKSNVTEGELFLPEHFDGKGPGI